MIIMNLKKFNSTLLAKLCDYESKELIDHPTHEKLAAYLKSENKSLSENNFGMYMLYALGTLLFAFGLILLTSHNWDYLARPVRLSIAFLPLIASIVMTIFMLPKFKGSAWMELPATLNIIGVICAIAVVSQIYHIDGNLWSFVTGVLALTILVPILYNSKLALLICVVNFLILMPDGIYKFENLQTLHIFTLIIAALIFLFYFKCSGGLFWFLSALIYLSSVPFILCNLTDKFYDNNIPEILFSSIYFSILLLIDFNFSDNTAYAAKKSNVLERLPFILIGITGLVYISIFHIFIDENMFGKFYEKEDPIYPISSLVLIFVLLAAFLFLSAKAINKTIKNNGLSQNPPFIFMALISLVVCLEYVLNLYFAPDSFLFFIKVLSAIVLSASALLFIFKGMKFDNFLSLNLGAIIVIAQAIAYFFKMDTSMLIRAFLYILFGLILIGLNLFLVNKKNLKGKVD